MFLVAMNQLNIQELSSKQLLILCATAIETNNKALVQQTVHALRPKSSVNGDPGERVTAYFLKALVQRAGSLLDPNVLLTGHRFSLPQGKQSPKKVHEVKIHCTRICAFMKLTFAN
jgi:hypothetical protein